MGFGVAGKRQAAEPDWDRFSNEVGVRVLAVPHDEVQLAIHYIFEQPPKRQIWVDGSVDWEVVPNNERSPQLLFAHIRRARNNLHHGGKFGSQWIDPDRSHRLPTSGHLVLRRLIPLDANLSEAINGAV